MAGGFVNSKYFDRTPIGKKAPNQAGSLWQQSYLEARGFDARGYRTGGILEPAEVDLPKDTILFRFYGGSQSWSGRWWITPFELAGIVDYFGHYDFNVGRAHGRGMLHGSLAVLAREWRNSMRHYCVVKLRSPFKAFYGEGDHALIGSRGGFKAALIRDPRTGAQRAARQLFLPGFGEFTDNVDVLVQGGLTDRGLTSGLKRFYRSPLAFEA
jgi:hypothetical protein